MGTRQYTMVSCWVLLLVFTSSLAARLARESTGRSRPRQVTAININSTSIELRWLHPRPEDGITGNCPVTKYQVRTKAEGSSESQTLKVDGDRTSVILNQLMPDTVYNIRLVGLLCNGEKTYPSRWVVLRTLDSRDEIHQSQAEVDVPGQATNVQTRTFSDSIVVNWRPPRDRNTLVRGYICGYGQGVPDVNWKYVDATRRNVTITNLASGTAYVVSLRAYNNVGKGAVVYKLVTTRESTPGSVPRNILVQQGDLASEVTVEWRHPRLPNGDITGYDIYYTVRPDLDDGDWFFKSVAGSLQEASIGPMAPNTTYHFKIRARNGNGHGPMSEIVAYTTPVIRDEPASAPRSVTASPGNYATEVRLTWREPRTRQSPINGYVVYFTWSLDMPSSEWQRRQLRTATTQATITGLRPNITYYFKVVAQTVRGLGELSEQVQYFTRDVAMPAEDTSDGRVEIPESLESTSPLSPIGPQTNNTEPGITKRENPDTNPRANHIDFKTQLQYHVTAYITWPESPRGLCDPHHGDVTSYRFRYYRSDARDQPVHPMYIHQDLSVNFVVLSGLLPDNSYSYQVKYITDEESEWSQEETFLTSYGPPS